MSEYDERARHRRQNWGGGTVSPPEALVEAERSYWRSASASAKFDAVWQMALEA